MAIKNDKAGKVLNPNTGVVAYQQDIGSEAGKYLDGFKNLLGLGLETYSTVATLKTQAEISKAEKERALSQARAYEAMGQGANNGVPQGSGSGPLPGINGVLAAGGGTVNVLMLAAAGLLGAYVIFGRK